MVENDSHLKPVVMSRNLSAEGGEETRSDRTGPARRSEERDAGRLVLEAVRGAQGRAFLLRRARREVEELPAGPMKRVLSRVLDAVKGSGTGPPSPGCALLEWAGRLEGRGQLQKAARVLDVAREGRPGDAELALHRARISRTAGEEERAVELYRRVRELDTDGGRLSRMAEVGLALLSLEPEKELGRTLRRSLDAGDEEAAAVAQEARARVRRRQSEVEGALRDYAIAALRFRDPADRGRIVHEATGLLLAVGELRAARRLLRTAVSTAHPEQAERARSRLRAVSRRLGDQVGVRRWREARRPPAREFPPVEGTLPAEGDLDERVRRWLGRLERRAARDARAGSATWSRTDSNQ